MGRHGYVGTMQGKRPENDETCEGARPPKMLRHKTGDIGVDQDITLLYIHCRLPPEVTLMIGMVYKQ